MLVRKCMIKIHLFSWLLRGNHPLSHDSCTRPLECFARRLRRDWQSCCLRGKINSLWCHPSAGTNSTSTLRPCVCVGVCVRGRGKKDPYILGIISNISLGIKYNIIGQRRLLFSENERRSNNLSAILSKLKHMYAIKCSSVPLHVTSDEVTSFFSASCNISNNETHLRSRKGVDTLDTSSLYRTKRTVIYRKLFHPSQIARIPLHTHVPPTPPRTSFPPSVLLISPSSLLLWRCMRTAVHRKQAK